MNGEPPPIVAPGLADRTRALAETYSRWRSSPGDVGEGLVEAFGRIADVVAARINRVPDKLHVRLLELLDIRLEPPVAAEVDVRFRLAAPAAEPVRISAVTTEVAT